MSDLNSALNRVDQGHGSPEDGSFDPVSQVDGLRLAHVEQSSYGTHVKLDLPSHT